MKRMSDEEIISLNRMKLFAGSSDLSVVTAKDMNIVVTLVEKQQKEIEELTTNQLDLKDKCIKIAEKLEEDNKNFVAEYILAQIGACPVWECGEPYSNYISKDKIKAKIEELEKYRDKFYECNMLKDVIIKQNQIQVLQSLLEEGE